MGNDTPITDRFMKFVQVDEATGCWLWTGMLDTHGRGSFGLFRKLVQAHVVAYQLFVGPVPDGKELHHTCLTTRCVNWRHLKALTRTEHVAAHVAIRTHCKHGHALTPDNLYHNSKRERRCKQCAKEAARKQRERARG